MMETLRLLIVEESLNKAEDLASAVRNSGMAVRMTRLEDDEDLTQALEKQDWDMLLCPLSMHEFTATQALKIIEKSHKDIPMVLLTREEDDDDEVLEFLEKGARDAVRFEAEAHLQFVVNREARGLHNRRTLKKAMKALTEAEKRCRTLIDSSRDAIAYVHEGMHVYANSVYLEMFGYDEFEEIEGMPVMDMVAPEDHQNFKTFLKNYKNNKSGEQKLEIKGKRLDESSFDAVMEFAPATIDTEPCTQIVIRDQSQNQDLENKLKYLSNQDLVTSLHNRQYFIEELDLAAGRAKSGGESSFVLYVEIDNFQKVKESVGIAGNDVVLNDFANILRVTTQKLTDVVLARFSDSAFTVLLPKGKLELGTRLAEAIRKTVEDFIFEVDGKSLTLSCSIGVTSVGEQDENAQSVLSNADIACNIIRSNEGNGVHVHDPVKDMNAGKERDQQWANLIRQALENDMLRLVYQPIVSLHGEDSEIYEVLLRMQDHEGNTILPKQFLPSAEISGMMPAVDRWVVENAIRILHEQRQSGSLTRFFVKLSGSILQDETFLPWVARRFSQARMKGDAITFELAEKDIVYSLKHAKYFCKGVHELHCKVALDHFGTGNNSFNCLKHIEVDYLKIDGSFIHNLATDKKNQAMVKSFNEMAHGIGKMTIAEFVQDATSLALLWQYGINYIQGNYLQKPYENLSYDFTGESEIV